jgi:hypothetical protein
MDSMTRRELLSKSTVLLLLVPVACSSSNATTIPSNLDASTCNGVFELSTVTNNHTHTLCVPFTDLSAPPTAGVTYTTSTDDGHNHTVVLTQAQLQTIAGGSSVTVTTSTPFPHDFTIKKA